jgi:hypothetical protein
MGIIKQLFQFIVYHKYTPLQSRHIFEAIPEDQQKIDINDPLDAFGPNIQRIVRKIEIDEYMENANYSLEDMIKLINKTDNARGRCVRRLPLNMHTPEYLTELDETLSEFVYNEDSLDTVISIINNHLFLNEIYDLIEGLTDFFFETIEPQINRLYGHPIYNPETGEYE